MRKKKRQFVEVEWLDAIHDADEYDIEKEVLYPATQVTRGWLIRNEPYENFITIANEISKESPNMVRGLDTIPKGMIVSITKKR